MTAEQMEKIKKVMESAPRMKWMAEAQFVVETESGDYELDTMFGALFNVPKVIDGKKVVAYRSFSPTGYSTDQQGPWSNVE